MQDHKCRDVRVKASLYYKIIGEVSPGSPNRLEVNGTWFRICFTKKKRPGALFNWHRLSDVIPLFGHPEFFYYLLYRCFQEYKGTLECKSFLQRFFWGKTVRMQSC